MRPIDLQVNVNSSMSASKLKMMQKNAIASQYLMMDEKLKKQHEKDLASIKKVGTNADSTKMHDKEDSLKNNPETLLYVHEKNKKHQNEKQSFKKKSTSSEINSDTETTQKETKDKAIIEEHNWTA